MRSSLAFVVALSSLLPTVAFGQESGSALSSPRPGVAETPSTGVAAPPSSSATSSAPSEVAVLEEVPPATENAADLGTVPPPPPGGYDPAVRYPTAEPQTPSAPGFEAPRPSESAIPSRLATRLRVLDASLGALAARGNNGVVDGVLAIAGGGTLVGLGAWVREDRREMGMYMMLMGSANVVRGVVGLAITPRPSRSHVAFTHMPMGTLEEVQSRLDFGERELETIARRSKTLRILDASLNMAAGIAIVPVYLAPNDFKVVDPFDYFILIGSGISVLSGLISLFTRSDAERRWEAYQDLRDRLVREEGATAEVEGFRVRGAGVAPLRAGAALTLDATF
ncbi:MAG: hypothetical protein H6721_12500 [Sandaracinus sp.]|nr:hypothetical protein [Sandaracinus sp.]MCB9622678.1 hypothetical protein [Sandaracinus sp.]MCB9632939.1 hypothetical protein [Sandaracinus sp.]